MRYAHVINYLSSAPWAIQLEKLQAIISLIELRAAGLTLSDSEIESRIGPTEREKVTAPGSIAVIPIHGTISHRMSMLRRASGGMSVEEFRQDFRAAVLDPNIAAIVLDIDSPGGSVYGIEEMADEIFAARSEKRIIASVNALAASAGYWLASSAHQIAMMPSAHVGSIGVLGVHADFSEKAKAEGVKITVVSAGKHKAEASEFTPLSDDARQHMQSLVDDRYDAFVRAVARGRGVALKTVRDGFGQGRLVTAKTAIADRMADSIETLDQVLSRTATRATRAKKIAEAASWQIDITGNGGIAGVGAAVLNETVAEVAAEEFSSFVPQAVIIPKGKCKTLEDAKLWAKENGQKSDQPTETEGTWRFRQRDEGDFASLHSVPISADGVVVIGGPLKPGIQVEIPKPKPAPEPPPKATEPVVIDPAHDPNRVALELLQLG